MHQRLELRIEFGAEITFGIETGQQRGDVFSLVGENEIVIAGLACFFIQIEAASVPFIPLIYGIMQIAVVCKVRIEIGEFVCVVIFLIVAVLEDQDAKSVLLVGIRVEFDPFPPVRKCSGRRSETVEAVGGADS